MEELTIPHYDKAINYLILSSEKDEIEFDKDRNGVYIEYDNLKDIDPSIQEFFDEMDLEEQ